MGHSITAIILKDTFDKNKANAFDLVPIALDFGLTLFPINHYYSACWQHKLKTSGLLDISCMECILFPREMAIYEILKKISHSNNPEYAIIVTDYFGGIGEQYASVFVNANNANKNVTNINEALIHLGVFPKNSLDAFETIGLDKIRTQPAHLDKYVALVEEFGV